MKSIYLETACSNKQFIVTSFAIYTNDVLMLLETCCRGGLDTLDCFRNNNCS
jgi:hypothetical protein